MKAIVIALLCSAVGAGVALMMRDLITPPVSLVNPGGSYPATKSEVERLRGEIDQLSRDLDARRTTPEPARVEVTNDPREQIQSLATRVEAIEKQLADVVAQLEAMPQTHHTFRSVVSQTDAGDANSASPSKTELQRRLDAVDMNNADALVDVADWATAQGLNPDAKRVLRLAIKADPDNASARQQLGYAKYNGKWMTAREIEREKANGH
jgi:hypothetical protein